MAKEFLTVNEYLDIIGWTKPALSERLDVGLRIILRWANGQNDTPVVVLEWLDTLATVHLANKKPVGWGGLRLAPAPDNFAGGAYSRG